ncbi:AAA family ATPase [Roseovarius pelagicus]|uniref:AAA family ATPase n=1 Tax=Roseovarius pelagicus TaxID=2980108 RepID=A0ABY6DCI6_9RHOB|nr:AAA family ATPase [Roseovarius pelagicus]UXX83800.1 AAA family ATPase [Roseovarius pelagicus]
MFEKDGLNTLYRGHRKTLTKVNAVASALNLRFYKMEDAIECLMIATMSGEAMVMIGPPGTAKSRLMRSFCNLLDLIPDTALIGGEDKRAEDDPSHEAYFEYLLTQFTEPSELFGFYDLAALSKGMGLVRDDRNMMHKAQVVFLDEVFNASSAILNSLLTFMNERKFHDRGKVISTPLRLLVSATNHPPQDPTLGAVYDRFLLRCRVVNVANEGVDQDDLVQLLQTGWKETHAAELDKKPDCAGLLEDLKRFQEDVDARTKSGSLRIDPAHPVFATFTQMVSTMLKYELSDMSNRRIVKLAGLVLSLRLLRADRDGESDIEIQTRDLDVVSRFSLDREDASGQKRLNEELKLG